MTRVVPDQDLLDDCDGNGADTGRQTRRRLASSQAADQADIGRPDPSGNDHRKPGVRRAEELRRGQGSVHGVPREARRPQFHAHGAANCGRIDRSEAPQAIKVQLVTRKDRP